MARKVWKIDEASILIFDASLFGKVTVHLNGRLIYQKMHFGKSYHINLILPSGKGASVKATFSDVKLLVAGEPVLELAQQQSMVAT